MGCPTVTGAELERYGGSGTAGSHWAARVFSSETMGGWLGTKPAFSKLSLAMFEDR